MKKVFNLIIAALLIGGFSFLQACDDENNDEELQNMESDSELEVEKQEKAENIRTVLYSIPSPIETAAMVKMSGVDFNNAAMNNPNKVGDYNTTKSQAFNLGVYGSDLAYSSIFEQSQEALQYFSAVKLLSDELGVSGVINDENISRFERNIENRDSLMVFVNEIFWAIDATLVEEDRGYVSAIVMSGGWIEAVYIILKNGNGLEGEDLDRIKVLLADQHYSLENILKLISAYEDNSNLLVLSGELSKLNDLFGRIIKQENSTDVNRDESGKVVIGGQANEITISEDLLEQIFTEVNQIRDKYVN